MIIILLTVTIILTVIAYTVTISIKTTDYYNYISKSNYQLSNRRLAELLNGSLTSNIPSIIVSSKNSTVCSTSFAIFLTKLPEDIRPVEDYELHNETTDSIYDSGCKKICPNSSLQSLVIRDHKKQEIFADNKQLHEGIWCVKTRPRCNLRTTYAVMTMTNDVVCRSKFPNFFAGPEGNKVIACNNSVYYHPDNILIDELDGSRVDPRTINMTHEDQLLDYGDPQSFRFKCRFDGTDSLGNKFVEHPLNRLHPMRNPCTLEIPNAHQNFKFDRVRGECSCTTRVSDVGNRTPGDLKTPCTSCRSYWKDNKLRIREPCFPTNSVYTEARRKLPCYTGKPEPIKVPCMALQDLDMVRHKIKGTSSDTDKIVLPLFNGTAETTGCIKGSYVIYSWFENKWINNRAATYTGP